MIIVNMVGVCKGLNKWELHEFSANAIGINKSGVECRKNYVTQIEISLGTKHEKPRHRSSRMPLLQI
jgi:hypothetical protein